jgi:hypothetical protein
MTEAFVFTETDRTKSRWVAKAYNDFVRETGRSRTTLRGLFYYALQRTASDYPLCGGFVGEIRITRPYHESDGAKLSKWMSKARTLRFIPADAILDEIPGENVFLPDEGQVRTTPVEVWLNKSALNPLLYPVCQKHGATLVSVNGRASDESVKALYRRCCSPTTILCLSDLRPDSVFFARDLAAKIAELRPQGCSVFIGLKSIGLLPEQILELKIPMVQGSKEKNEVQEKYKNFLKPYALDAKGMAELDALEVYYPGGIAGFLEDALSRNPKVL